MNFKYILFSLVILFSLSACANDEQGTSGKTLTISAAVSLADVLKEIEALYREEQSIELTFNLGGSGTLVQQIQQGAPADLFISANEEWMETLKKNELILQDTYTEITSNELVLIANDENLKGQPIEELIKNSQGKIAIGHPDSVPAGKYAKQMLENLNLWETIEDRLVRAKDVRQVLTYVETGNADLGFVYKSDALLSEDIHLITTIDEKWHDPIFYPGAIIKGTKHLEEAEEFLKFLQSDVAKKIFKEHGFTS